MEKFIATERTTLKRLPKRGVYDRETIYQILDEAFICHIGFVANGYPVVIPTGYGRQGDKLVIHASAASRMIRSLSEGIDISVTVTLLDGIVLARSAFHHSFNYRSVVIFGRATVIQDRNEKMLALKSFTNHIVPNRWEEVREPNEQELKATTVLALPLEEASGKIRTGYPVDDEEDYKIPVWAGILPVQSTFSSLIADERNLAEPSISLKEYIKNGRSK
jgi:nitroimidazol reductase NimA-like FMN-containing flavoprotein (pyridoxamine 5'-phosphate oxidase superfamily)